MTTKLKLAATAAAQAPARPTVPSPAADGTAVRLRNLVKRYGSRRVLDGIDLDIAPGEFLAIVGRSGCGKSTLLRVLAGLESFDNEAGIDGAAPAQRRDEVRVMFQEPRLLPWKRVLDNIALGLEGSDARKRALELLAEVGLADRADDWPAQLSGGQRQRVALARALVHRPRLLLLDEPLGALDALTRIEMQSLIENLWRTHGFTAVLVTHDVQEAVAMADRIVLIEDGRITLDRDVPLARPRSRGRPEFAAIEEAVLDRVLKTPRPPEQPAPDATAVRWAI
ncbi:ATP-binding cassette domain-containing protein [Derxia lacustris]|uniref:ATP-binding cassette domain-containing protein n=1 Tax=Derxia lacustris TaxID=764842 RepID=UPI000A1783F1|nr:ATP-binding cassette domain-containing protein [Derxia lacustris]